MRILHVARYGSLRGGAERYLRVIADAQREAGHDVSLVYALDPDPEWPEAAAGVPVPSVGDARAGADAPALREAIEAARADVVHVHVPDVAWVAPAAAEVAPTLLAVHDHRLNCPVATKYWSGWHRRCVVPPGPWCLAFNATAHCGSLRANATLRPYRAWRRAHDAALGMPLQVFSDAMRRELETAGYAPEAVAVTPYPAPPLGPVDLADTDDDERPVILVVARLNSEKGVPELVRSLSWVDVPAHLVVVGDGHGYDAVAVESLRAPAVHRVTVAGWLPPASVAGWIERAAVVALPSMWPEPFGIVGLEAMARARPVVAFDTGGIPEWLEHGVTGLLAPPGDIAGLGRAIGTILGEPDLGNRLGEAGALRIQERYSVVGHLERLITLYEQVRRDRETAT